MNTHHINPNTVSVDELWLGEWAAEGIAALQDYLSRHAAFAAFLDARSGLDSTYGDGAAQR